MSWITSVGDHISAGVGALIAGMAVAFGVSKVRRSNAEDSKEAALDDTTSNVVRLLYEQLDRSEKYNKKLEETVQALHAEVAKLRTEVLYLRNINGSQKSSSTN